MLKKPSERQLENLIALFRAARDTLLDTIVNYRGVGTKVYANTILMQVKKQLERLEKQAGVYAGSVIPAEYQRALDEIYAYFRKNNLLMKPPAAFAQLHNDAIYALVRDMQYQIGQGLEQVGRRILRYVDSARDNALRLSGLRASGGKFASGGTVDRMRENLIAMLRDEGFMTVQYGSGPRAFQVPLDVYAGMVARSTTREAGNVALENQLTANGYDLVQITTHYPTCELCAQFQGRVYSISGKDTRFPPLSRAFAGGYHNIHPNCRHVIVAWIESLKTPEEASQAVEESSRPFKDVRNQAEIDLYNRQQAENRRARQDLYQYERYKMRLGEDAPRSFHEFRKVKKAGGEKWDRMQLDYRRRSRLLADPSLGLPDADNAFADESKFTKYFFGGPNPDGLSKGVAFTSHLGYDINNWRDFEAEMLSKAKLSPASFDHETKHGKYYNQPMVLYGPKKNPMDVLVVWESKNGKPRFITAFPNRGDD